MLCYKRNNSTSSFRTKTLGFGLSFVNVLQSLVTPITESFITTPASYNVIYFSFKYDRSSESINTFCFAC